MEKGEGWKEEDEENMEEEKGGNKYTGIYIKVQIHLFAYIFYLFDK